MMGWSSASRMLADDRVLTATRYLVWAPALLLGTQDTPGQRTGPCAVTHDLGAVDQHVVNADRIGIEPARTARQVTAETDRTRPDRRFVEQDEVGVEPFRDAPAQTGATQPRRRIGDLVHCLFEGQQLALAYRPTEQRGGVRERRGVVEMRPRVGRADQHARVAPHFGPQLPARVVVARWFGGETGVDATR